MTSLRWNLPMFTPGLLLGAKTRRLIFLTESNIPSFFEQNLTYLCYSAALCIQINNFRPNGMAKMRQFFEFL